MIDVIASDCKSRQRYNVASFSQAPKFTRQDKKLAFSTTRITREPFSSFSSKQQSSENGTAIRHNFPPQLPSMIF